MNLHNVSKKLALLLISLVFVTNLAYSSTPEKPYPALAEGDRLTAAWLMGMFNVIYDWAQTTNNTFTLHTEATAAHGATGAVVGTSNSQTLTNKSMGSGCTWGGTAVPVANGGTGATSAAAALSNLGAASSGHVHNYAGSSTPGGAATSAVSASTATNASYATTAGSATNATNASYATTAGSATNATNASYATTAGSATNATNASYATTAGTAYAIRTSAPGSPANGDIWLE